MKFARQRRHTNGSVEQNAKIKTKYSRKYEAIKYTLKHLYEPPLYHVMFNYERCISDGELMSFRHYSFYGTIHSRSVANPSAIESMRDFASMHTKNRRAHALTASFFKCDS